MTTPRTTAFDRLADTVAVKNLPDGLSGLMLEALTAAQHLARNAALLERLLADGVSLDGDDRFTAATRLSETNDAIQLYARRLDILSTVTVHRLV